MSAPRMLYPTCPKCQGVMEEGYFLEHTDGGGYASLKWAEGVPRKSIWTGLKVSGQRQLCITNYRCIDCGYLEAYAVKAPE